MSSRWNGVPTLKTNHAIALAMYSLSHIFPYYPILSHTIPLYTTVLYMLIIYPWNSHQRFWVTQVDFPAGLASRSSSVRSLNKPRRRSPRAGRNLRSSPWICDLWIHETSWSKHGLNSKYSNLLMQFDTVYILVMLIEEIVIFKPYYFMKSLLGWGKNVSIYIYHNNNNNYYYYDI